MIDVVATHAEAGALDVPPLIVTDGLAPHVPGDGPIELTRLGEGHSNETFLVTRDGAGWVLRRPPRPPFAPSAHDVLREAAVIEALSAQGVRVPRVVATCADERAIGAPFFLMERVDGVVVRDTLPPGLDDPAGRRAVTEQFVDGLVELHAVRWERTALERIGRPDGYLERQLRRWTSQWEHNRTRPVPAIEALGERLRERPPQTTRTTVVHGDYKLDNLLFADGPPARRRATVDWELATLGDPLADLGYLLATYVDPGEAPDPLRGFSPATAAAGSLTRAQLVARYEQGTGAVAARLDWYVCLALWKLAILLEGSYKRYRAGATADPFFARLEDGVPRIAADGLALSDRGV